MRGRDGIRLLLVASACFCAILVHASLTPTIVQGQAGSLPNFTFNRDIRPILSNNCFACHGPDEKQRETKFHFDTKEAAFLEEGVIIPGNAAKSKLVWRITNPDP